jgi:hypothetical protein
MHCDVTVACADMEEEAKPASSSEPVPNSMAAQPGTAPESEAAAAAQEDSAVEPEQDGDEEEDWDDEDDDKDDDSLPSFEFRVETAKLLIELDEDNNAATQVRRKA